MAAPHGAKWRVSRHIIGISWRKQHIVSASRNGGMKHQAARHNKTRHKAAPQSSKLQRRRISVTRQHANKRIVTTLAQSQQHTANVWRWQ